MIHTCKPICAHCGGTGYCDVSVLTYHERKPAALELVRGGMSGAEAARKVNITSGALYRDKTYKQIMADRAKEKTDAK